MVRAVCVCVLAGVAAWPAWGQGPPRFRFAAGDVLTYSVEQLTTVTETAAPTGGKPGEAAVSKVKLNLARRWDVVSVDPAGGATLTLTVTAMKQELTRPGANKDDVVAVDSATPDGKEALKDVLNKPVLTVKLDAAGALVGADAANGAGTGRVAAELPFRVVLPAAKPAVNAPWTRPAVLTLDPPHGAGEKVELVQTATLKGESQGYWVLGVSTAAKAEAKDPAVRLAAVPVLWEGDVFFDPAKGRYAGARLKVKKEVPDAAGPGSKFAYESTLVEALAK